MQKQLRRNDELLSRVRLALSGMGAAPPAAAAPAGGSSSRLSISRGSSFSAASLDDHLPAAGAADTEVCQIAQTASECLSRWRAAHEEAVDAASFACWTAGEVVAGELRRLADALVSTDDHADSEAILRKIDQSVRALADAVDHLKQCLRKQAEAFPVADVSAALQQLKGVLSARAVALLALATMCRQCKTINESA